VESRQGTGSAFFFALPLAGGAAQAAVKTINLETLVNELKEHSSMNSTPGSWKSILVVDDDLSIRNLLRQELEDAGYRVREAGNSMEALNAIRVERPDLIVLDVMMPGMNGFDAAAVLKNDPRTADIPVIILSVLEDRERGYRIGIDRYFTKPFNTEQLINEIGQLVSRGRSGKKILVVDEDNSTLKVLSDALESRGYTVVGVCEGKECINTVLAEQPDMIILDAMHTAQRHLVKTLRYEKGLENVAFILLGEQEKKQ
jgi:CheY-like chemotaxis protein